MKAPELTNEQKIALFDLLGDRWHHTFNVNAICQALNLVSRDGLAESLNRGVSRLAFLISEGIIPRPPVQIRNRYFWHKDQVEGIKEAVAEFDGNDLRSSVRQLMPLLKRSMGRRACAGEITHKKIGQLLGVSQATVSRLVLDIQGDEKSKA